MLSLLVHITSYQCSFNNIPMQKMITVVFLGLLFLSGPAFTEMCGPESCGLICTEEESCLQDLEVRADITGHLVSVVS